MPTVIATVVASVAVGVGVAVAAACGALLRFAVGRWLNGELPYGTLAVNVVASLALGVISAADDPFPVIVGIGGLGALSTWSTAANEVASLARDGQGSLAAGHLGLTVSTGVLAAWVGLQIGALVF